MFVKTPVLNTTQNEAILRIWNAEYPIALRYQDLEALDVFLDRMSDPVHYLSLDETGTPIGWLAAFDRDEERWITIMVDSSAQKKGIGSALLDRAKADELVLNGWVVDHNRDRKSNGEPYRSPLAFYQMHGFEVLGDVRLENEQLSCVKIRWTRQQ